ncbi:hypothetical protein XPA_010283 [Xanthoria parietina]
MAFPSNAPFGEIFGEIPTRSPSPPRLVYSYPAGYKHRVDSSDSNPSSSQSAGKEISDHEQLRHVDRSTQPARSMISRSTPYVCHHPGCDTPLHPTQRPSPPYEDIIAPTQSTIVHMVRKSAASVRGLARMVS